MTYSGNSARFSGPGTRHSGQSFNGGSRQTLRSPGIVRNNSHVPNSSFRANGAGFGRGSVAQNHARYRVGSGSHNNWGGSHHNADLHLAYHHHDFGLGFGYAGYGYPYGYYPYGYRYGNGYGYNQYNGGLNVADVQQALAGAGYYRDQIDGIFGYNTSQAIRAFQATNGLPVTGQIDGPLVRALGLG